MAKLNLDHDTLVQRINSYIVRASYDKRVVVLPLEQEGLFRIVGAAPFARGPNSDAFRSVLEHDTVKGRFIDALVFAFNQQDFYSSRQPELYEHGDTTLQGYVEVLKITDLPKKFDVKDLTRTKLRT